MTISKQKLVLAFTLALLSAVSARAITLEEIFWLQEQKLKNEYGFGSPLLSCESEQGEDLRKDMTQPIENRDKTMEEQSKTIEELQAKILALETQNKPTKTNSWSTRKKVAVAAATVAGACMAAPYVYSLIREEYFGYGSWKTKFSLED